MRSFLFSKNGFFSKTGLSKNGPVKNALALPKNALVLSASAWLCIAASAAGAQTASEAERAAERIQRETQQRQQQQMEENRRELPASKGVDLTPQNTANGIPSGSCRDIQRIVVNGTPKFPLENFPASEQNRIIKAYNGRCLYAQDIEKLLADITAYYIEQGLVAARAYVPQQDISSGRLDILVVEGRVEKIIVRDGDKHSVSVGNVLPFVENQPLNIRDLEQGLDQINRLLSNRASFDIQPGSEQGSSQVVINNEPSRRVRAQLTADNQGSAATGKQQLGLSVSADNPLGFNDYISATHRQALPEDDAQRRSSIDSVAYILPLGYNTFSLAGSRSYYRSALATQSGLVLKSDGDNTIASAKLERVLYRSRSDRLSANVGITSKASHNYLEDQLLAVSSRRLSILDIGIDYSTGLFGGVVNFDLGYARGLDNLGALTDQANLPASAPRAQFRKINYGAGYTLPFAIDDMQASYSSTLVGQRALDALYGSEQILIGGIYSVRGFVDNTLSGDSGYFWRNELALRLPLQETALFAEHGWSGFLRPYVALDHGHTSMLHRDTGAPSGSLTGIAAGFTINSGRVSWDLFNGRPLNVPEGTRREGSSTYFTVTVQL